MKLAQLVDQERALSKEIAELIQGLKKLRGIHSELPGKWQEGIEKDERVTVKLLYSQFQIKTEEYHKLMDTDVYLPNQINVPVCAECGKFFQCDNCSSTVIKV